VGFGVAVGLGVDVTGGAGFPPRVLLLSALLLSRNGVGAGVGVPLGEGYAFVVTLLLDAGESLLTHPPQRTPVRSSESSQMEFFIVSSRGVRRGVV